MGAAACAASPTAPRFWFSAPLIRTRGNNTQHSRRQDTTTPRPALRAARPNQRALSDARRSASGRHRSEYGSRQVRRSTTRQRTLSPPPRAFGHLSAVTSQGGARRRWPCRTRAATPVRDTPGARRSPPLLAPPNSRKRACPMMRDRVSGPAVRPPGAAPNPMRIPAVDACSAPEIPLPGKAKETAAEEPRYTDARRWMSGFLFGSGN